MRLHEKKEKPKHAKSRPGAAAALFFIVLAVLTVTAFIIPLRPTRSYSEKRSLTPFPEFSGAALASGNTLTASPPGFPTPSPAGRHGSA